MAESLVVQECLFANKNGTILICSCEAGFTGKYCNDSIDDCASSPCLNEGRCLDLHLDYKCKCPNGFFYFIAFKKMLFYKLKSV